MRKTRRSGIMALLLAAGILMTGCEVATPAEPAITGTGNSETKETSVSIEAETTSDISETIPAEIESTTTPAETEVVIETHPAEIDEENNFSDLPFDELFSYTVFDDHVRIDKCLKFSSCYIIPEEIEGKRVTEIGERCFVDVQDEQFIQKVVLPDTIEVINSGAMREVGSFMGLRMNIPANLKIIGEYAFYDCGWTDVTIPAGVTEIGEYAFSSDYENITPDYLQLVRFEGDMETLPEGCFSGNKYLQYVYLPENLTSISTFCFADCAKLKEIALPGSVSRLDNSAFISCESLENVTFSENLTSIGESVFRNTAFLKANQPLIMNGILVDYSTAEGNVVVPDNVTVICENAFHKNENITSVTIPDGVSVIGRDAFSWCTSLKSIVIPDTVTTIERFAFSGCEVLNNVVIPDSVTFIGSNAFKRCKALDNITIPETIPYIDGEAFRKTPFLEANQPLIINNVLISYSADDEITEAVIPDGVTKIAPHAFRYYSKLKSVTIPEGVTEIGEGAFYGCDSLTGVIIPDSVTEIGGISFGSCESLTSVSMPSDTIIGDDAFFRTPIAEDSSLVEYR